MSAYSFKCKLPSVKVTQQLLVTLEKCVLDEIRGLDGELKNDFVYSVVLRETSGSEEAFTTAAQLPAGKFNDALSSVELRFDTAWKAESRATVNILFSEGSGSTRLRCTLSGANPRPACARIQERILTTLGAHRTHHDWIHFGGDSLTAAIGITGCVAAAGAIISWRTVPLGIALGSAIFCFSAFAIRAVYLPYTLFDSALAEKRADTGKWLVRLLIAAIVITPLVNWVIKKFGPLFQEQ